MQKIKCQLNATVQAFPSVRAFFRKVIGAFFIPIVLAKSIFCEEFVFWSEPAAMC